MLEDLVVGLLYLPFLIAPFALLFWYAFAPSRAEAEPVKTVPVTPVDDAGQHPAR